ncbi:hypothetical protein GCM10009416_40040 [Craurococcus roseus]|uniref:TadE-like domain-containing protein n=1 Tax=Craurococcus roseus TaxID=77585 RepID=A0ABN1FTY5_9PROT
MAAPVRNVARDRRGVAALEFAIVLPVLLLLLVGFLDVAYLARGYLRAQTAATQVGQIISQCTSVSSADDAVIAKFAERTLGPFRKPGKQWAVVVTAIGVNAANQPERWWVMDNRGTNAGAFATDGISLPANFALRAGEAMFRTEVFIQLDSMLFSKANSLLVEKIGLSKINSITTVTSSLLHTSRAPDTSKLKTKTSATGACLS